MVLLIATITLAVTTTMLYMLTQSTRYSGLGKRFASSSECAQSGISVLTEFIGSVDTQAKRQILVDNIGLLPETTTANSCESRKISDDFNAWKDDCDYSLIINPKDSATYDISFNLGPTCDVYSKIVYTFKGNTRVSSRGGDTGTRWRNTCVVHCGDYQMGGETLYSSYIVEIEARSSTNPNDRARLSVHYQY